LGILPDNLKGRNYSSAATHPANGSTLRTITSNCNSNEEGGFQPPSSNYYIQNKEVSVTHLSIALTILLLSLYSISAIADTTYVQGQVEGVWTAENSPYVVVFTEEHQGIYIDSEDTLIIEPGVTVLFEFTALLWVYGSGYISAVGTSDDSIQFIPLGQTEWWGITTGFGRFDYCYFESASHNGSEDLGALTIGSSEMSYIGHSTFNLCYRGIAAIDQAHIESCQFKNGDSGILIQAEFAYIKDCVFTDLSGSEAIHAIDVVDDNNLPIRIESCVFENIRVNAFGYTVLS
jgi:hypothetical protein